jgi:hypothetical protein
MFEHIIWKKKSGLSKWLYLGLGQMVFNWDAVDGVIASRYLHQKKVLLPVGLSKREIGSYIKNQQANVMQLDASEFNFQWIPIYHHTQKRVDAIWLMAFKKSYIDESIKYLASQKKMVCRMVCDWQYAWNHFLRFQATSVLKNRAYVWCDVFQTMSLCLGVIQDKIIHIEIHPKKADIHWLEQQVEAFKSRSPKDFLIDYFCSKEVLDLHGHHQEQKWTLITKSSIQCI